VQYQLMANSSLPTPLILQGLIWVAIFNLTCLHKNLYPWFFSLCPSYLRCWITLNNSHIFLEIDIANLFLFLFIHDEFNSKFKKMFLMFAHQHIVYYCDNVWPFIIFFFLPFLLCNLCRPLLRSLALCFLLWCPTPFCLSLLFSHPWQTLQGPIL
jgi:hypothetical protein